MVIKPDGYEKTGEIMDQILQAGFVITKVKMVRLSHAQAEQFYADQFIDSQFAELVKEIKSNAIIALEVVRDDSLAALEKLIEASSSGNFLVISKNPDLNLFALPSTVTTAPCTLLLIKPHAVIAAQSGKIIDAVLKAGFYISSLELRCLKVVEASEFLEVYKGVLIEFSAMVSQYSAGPLIAVAISGDNCLNDLRALCGPSDPEVARVLRPNSLRALFGSNKVENGVHCTDLEEDGSLEVEYFFKILPAANQEV